MIPGRSMLACSWIPMPLRMILREPSLNAPEHVTSWNDGKAQRQEILLEKFIWFFYGVHIPWERAVKFSIWSTLSVLYQTSSYSNDNDDLWLVDRCRSKPSVSSLVICSKKKITGEMEKKNQPWILKFLFIFAEQNKDGHMEKKKKPSSSWCWRLRVRRE